MKRFQSTKVRKFCLRLCYQKRCLNCHQPCCRCCFLHMVMKLKCKTYLSNIPLKFWKFQSIFWKKCYKIVWKFQNKKKMQQQINIVWFTFHIINIQVYFSLITASQHLYFSSWEVSFNVSFSFGHDDENKL